mgnify:CR=1 FL=1
MYTIKTLNAISPVGLAKLPANQFEIDNEAAAPQGILVRSADMHDTPLPDSLLAIARAGAGTNNIPVEDCTNKGIVVFNTPGANANAVAELVVGALVAGSRNLVDAVNWAQTLKGRDTIAKDVEKGKKAFVGPELRGKTLGVIGLGAIGARVANAAVALGMEVLGYDPYISIDAAWSLSRSVQHCVTLGDMLPRCDYLTIHVPYLPTTRHTINAQTLAMCKDGVRVLNFARGELVDNAALLDALNSGKYDRGVIVAESFDYEIIDKAYQPYDNLSLLVCLKSTGEIEKKVIASVTESLKADYSFGADWARLVEIFQAPSLQMISFTITEKGYGVAPADLERGLTPVLAMGKVTALLYERFKAGALPLTVQSMDNCSHNGDKVKTAVFAYASKWVEQGLVPAEFLAYVQDETKITFPWSMIDKITPRPDAKVQQMLADDGFEDNYTIVTEKHTFTAPFVNAEETQYLCIEDHYTNGRPPLELGGVLYCDRETVDKIEKMKVCTCLNPLHTAMSIYGCMLGYTLISAEMADEDLRSFIQKIGYIEAMPVVVDPGVLNPYEFIGAVINRRLPNPFMPDAPQRIATDTSQKLAIRFGETIKAYEARGLDKSNLILIPLVLAGYARYLKGIDDNGQPFEISPDPLLAELQAIVNPLEVKEGEQDFSCLKALYSRADVFGVDLYAVGLGEKIESMAKELFAGPGAVRKTLHDAVNA